MNQMPFQCALVVLDVLGFKNKLNSESRYEVFKDFVSVAQMSFDVFGSKQTDGRQGSCHSDNEKVLLYSDTLIYFKKINDGIKPCDALVTSASFAIRVISSSLEKGLLVRGALAIGEMLYNETPEVIAGPVVNEAVEHYELGDWAGCHLAPSARDVLEYELKETTGERIEKWFSECDMPIKTRKWPILLSRQWRVRWLERLREIIEVEYLFEGSPLKVFIKKKEGEGLSTKEAVYQYFIELLNDYSRENSEACVKIKNTLASFEKM